MLIHVLNISFIDMFLHISYLFVLSCFIQYYLSFMLLFLYLSLFMYHHMSFILCFMPANTLEVDTGKNCMYLKVLSLYETVISICMTQTGPL